MYDVAISKTNNCNTHIVHLSRGKGNKTMKFIQLIEHDMGNIFLEKSYTRCVGESIPRPSYVIIPYM